MNKSKTTKKLFSFTFILSLTFIFIFLFSLVSTSFVSAAVPPQTNVNVDVGLDISFPKVAAIKQGEEYTFRFHVFNKSDGIRLDNTTVNCTFELYDNAGDEQVKIDVLEFDVEDWVITITEENFTRVGMYQYLVDCRTSTENYGGFISASFKVTPSGDDNVLGFFIILIGLAYIIGFIGFFRKNEWVSILGGFAMMILGIYIVQNGIDVYRNFMTTALSSITIGLGIIFTFVPLMEILRENY